MVIGLVIGKLYFLLKIREIHKFFSSKVLLWYIQYVTGFTKTVPIGTRNEIQFIADY